MLATPEPNIEEVTSRVMEFITKTSEDLNLPESDVVTGSLVALLLNFLQFKSIDKAEANAHLMSLLCSVYLITSANTTWLDTGTRMPEDKDKN